MVNAFVPNILIITWSHTSVWRASKCIYSWCGNKDAVLCDQCVTAAANLCTSCEELMLLWPICDKCYIKGTILAEVVFIVSSCWHVTQSHIHENKTTNKKTISMLTQYFCNYIRYSILKCNFDDWLLGRRKREIRIDIERLLKLNL